jgi:simple sugar transport system permease protein
MEDGPEARAPLEEEPEGYAPSVARRFALYQRAGGLLTPLLTAAFAFFMGGVIVLATGKNPFRTYQAIFEGAGLNWFFRFGNHHIDIPFTNHHVWFWWNTDTAGNAAYNLAQTLAASTPLILTGLAVAFAFRCGLFNIGGQGQYIVGAIVGVWVGSSFAGVAHFPHVLLAIVLASLAGALWAGLAGFLKATVGAHEVITTIMLNWVAYWAGSYAFANGGPLQSHTETSIPISSAIHASARLPQLWGDPQQGVHIGLLVAIAMLIVFWVVLKRTTLGYEIRAVGFNPEAARYGGIGVARSYVVAMGISGLFAGLAGALEILGRQYQLGVADVQVSTIGFFGIAVALLGRNTAVGTGLAALLFGALLTGTSTRSLDPRVFPPELADNLALMIQALVLLFVGADLLILYLWQARRKVRLSRRRTAALEKA